MRITYVTHTRFPTEKAHGHQVAQVCHAMAALGHDVTLVTPAIWNAITQNSHEYYGLPSSFAIQKLSHFDAQKSRMVPGFFGFAVTMMFYAQALKTYLATHKTDLLYVRSPFLLGAILSQKTPVILELHALPKRSQKKFVSQCNKCALIVCLTSGMKKELMSWGVEEQRVCVEADGVDMERFAHLPSADTAKSVYMLPMDCPILGYSGSLVTHDTIEKGVWEFVQALALLKKQGTQVFGWIIGGPENWRNIYEEKSRALGLGHGDIRFQGRVSAAEVPRMINAFDVCVYPAPASTHSYFTRDTSPLKLFEYLASGKPVVCADLPPLRDVVNESAVTFCKPGDAQSLADAIQNTIMKKDHEEQVQAAYDVAKAHTWQERMSRILKRVI